MASAALTGTTQTYDLTGLAEDIEDVIYNISPTATPLFTMAKKKKADGKFHQWQTDALAAAAANAQVEGGDATFAAASPTTLLGNYTQIFAKTVMVSGTADAVKKYGRAEEFAYQIAKKGKELKRDIEYSLVRNSHSTAGAAASARLSAGIESMIVGNAQESGATTTTPAYASGLWGTPTDGTSATLTEAIVVAALQMAWADGGDPSVIMANATAKHKFASFAGASTFAGTYDAQRGKAQGMVVGAVDVYVSDFGSHRIVLNRHQRDEVILCLDPDHVAVATLRPIKYTELAKTGDADKGQILTELCLVVTNPDAHAKIHNFVA